MSRIPSNSNVKNWNRLSVRIVVLVVLCSSLLTLLTTAFQLYYDYQKDVKSIHTNILFIEESYLPAIIFSVYTLDMEQVKILLEGTLNLIDIKYIEIDDTSNNIIKFAGKPTASKDVIRAFPLGYTTASGKKISLGTLKVSASFEGIYKRLEEKAYLSLLSNMLRMFVAALIFLAIINFIIIRHLKKISNFTQDLNLDKLDKELTLDRKTSELFKYDELDQLVSSLNDMKSRIHDDILMQKKAEKALKESEERFRKISENAPVLINSFDEDGRCLFWNKQCHKTFGWTIEEINEQEVAMALFYPDPAVCEEVIRTVTTDPDGSFREWHPVTKDGKILSMMWANFSLPNGQVFSMGHDITARKRAEEVLIERDEQYRAVVDNIGDYIMRYNRKFKHIYANRIALEATGLPIEQYIGKTHEEMGFPDHLCELWKKNIQLVFDTGRQQNIEFDVELPESKMSLELQLNPEFTAGGDVKTVIGISRDVSLRKQAETEKRKLESRLHQAQRMESVGQLASGVAHEINNPINGIMNYAQLIQDKIGEENPLSEYTSEIIHETKRVSKIVKNLLVFARQEKESHSPARIKDIVDDTMSLIQTVLKRDQITLVANISEDLPKIKCRSQQIQQVVMNLITNARDSLNEKYSGFDDNKKIEIISGFFEKGGRRWIRTTVEDHGLGIAQDTKERMFDPFYTTKERAKGTGLGLSISYGIVKDHHGELSVESEPGLYTRFHMDLPVDNGWDLQS